MDWSGEKWAWQRALKSPAPVRWNKLQQNAKVHCLISLAHFEIFVKSPKVQCASTLQ